MKKIAATCLLSLVTVTAFCGKDKKAEKMQVPTGPAVIFLGDSLTAGFGLDSPSDSYPALIQKKIHKSGLEYRVINAGVSGDTTSGGLARIGLYLREQLEPKVVVISLGSNDAMRGIPISEMEGNLRKTVRMVRDFDPKIKIFITQLYTFPNLGPEYGSQYGALFKKISQTENIELIPRFLDGVGGKPELNQEDGIHPNSEGAKILARNVWTTLKKYL